MLNELRKNYPNMTAEYLITTKPDHAFNLINRDQRTPIFEPEKWNESSLVVDAWAGHVYTSKEPRYFCHLFGLGLQVKT
jgi:hypothetical protein